MDVIGNVLWLFHVDSSSQRRRDHSPELAHGRDIHLCKLIRRHFLGDERSDSVLRGSVSVAVTSIAPVPVVTIHNTGVKDVTPRRSPTLHGAAATITDTPRKEATPRKTSTRRGAKRTLEGTLKDSTQAGSEEESGE